MLRARALEQARATALKARLEAAHKKLCEACANGGRIRMSIPTQPDDTDIVIGRALSEAIAYFTEAMLAVDPPPSGASPQVEPQAYIDIEFEGGPWTAVGLELLKLKDTRTIESLLRVINEARAAEAAQHQQEIAAWKVCPYCGAPLKVER